jgi:acyl dehydratase
MPRYQFPVEAAQIALFVRAAGGADVDISDTALAAPPTFVQSGAQFDPEWSVFAHGMLTMAMTAQALTDWLGGDHLTRYGVRFKKQVWPGDRLSVTAEVEDVRTDDSGQRLAEVTVTTRNGAGEEVLAGYVTARLGPQTGARP